MLMRAIRIHAFGDTSKMTVDHVPVPVPAAGQIVVKNEYCGVNYIDTYHRTGLYPLPLPVTLGREGAGVVSAVGEGVTNLSVGARVAYCSNVSGGYAEYTALPAWKAAVLPADVTFRDGATLMLQGLTAHYLARSSYAIQPKDTVLVLAGAGGVGMLLVQIAKLLGATVITTVSTADKAEFAKSLGADHVIIHREKAIDEETRRLTGGKGVVAVYDGVGKATYQATLNSLAPRGFAVFYGNASGPVPPIEPLDLMKRGSLFMTRANLEHYIATEEEFKSRCTELFQWTAEGKLKTHVHAEFPLEEAASAHKAIESGETRGKLLLRV